MKVQGGCHCGAIVYEGEVEAGTTGLCHCLDCQTLSGSAFRVQVPAPAASFRILKGSPNRYVKTADSGARRVHAFCGDCGSPIFSCADAEEPPVYSLRVGALAQRQDIDPPHRQIWTERRLAWVRRIEDIPEADAKGRP